MANFVTDHCEIEVKQQEDETYTFVVTTDGWMSFPQKPYTNYGEAVLAALVVAGTKPPKPDPALKALVEYLVSELFHVNVEQAVKMISEAANG